MRLDQEDPKKKETKMAQVKKKRKKRRKKKQKKVAAAVEFCPKCGCNLGAINKAIARAAK